LVDQIERGRILVDGRGCERVADYLGGPNSYK